MALHNAGAHNVFDVTLDQAFASFLEAGDRGTLVDYLLSRSNLPGPRANLELLRRFSEGVERGCQSDPTALWDLCVSFVTIPQDKAFTGSPMEFIPMCGTAGFGALGVYEDGEGCPYFTQSMEQLRSIAGDPRWRVREAVAIALQRILRSRQLDAVTTLSSWVEAGQWLQMRAVVAGVADPPLLKDVDLGRHAVELHRRIVGHAIEFLVDSHSATVTEALRSEPFRKLIQALEYSVSVVVAALPNEGFEFLGELAGYAVEGRANPASRKAALVIQRVVKANLKKNRLKRNFPDRVDRLVRMLDAP